MPRPTDTPLPLTAPRLAASMIPGPPPGDPRVTRLDEAGGDAFGDLVVAAPPGGPGRAEDRHRGPELGQQAETLHELGLDPQHPPGVGVHPIGGPAPVQQALISCCRRYLLAAQRGGSLATDPPVRL